MSSKTAFVIDDSKSARIMLSRMLKKSEYEVTQFESGDEFLSQKDDVALPDFIFMDHMMPGSDGLDTTRQLRVDQRFNNVPVFMYTSKEGEAYLTEALESGAVGVLPKPASSEQLSAVLSYEPNIAIEPAQVEAPPETAIEPQRVIKPEPLIEPKPAIELAEEIEDAEAVKEYERQAVVLLETQKDIGSVKDELSSLTKLLTSLESKLTDIDEQVKTSHRDENHGGHVTQDAMSAAVKQLNKQFDDKLANVASDVSNKLANVSLSTQEKNALKTEFEGLTSRIAQDKAERVAASQAEAAGAKVAAAQSEIITRQAMQQLEASTKSTKIISLVCLVVAAISLGLHFISM